MPGSSMPRVCDVVVSVPCFGCGAYVRECVESLLGQTHGDLTVIVVNDGDPEPPWPSLAGIADPRLVRFDLPRNRGRYFADQVVLEATNSQFFLVQDADDWSEPRRVELLLRELRRAHAAAAISATVRSDPATGTRRILRADGIRRPLSERFEHRANFTGLYRTSVLRAIGGFYAGFRVSFDTFVLNAVQMVGGVAVSDETLYHWRVRPGSLTRAAATGMGSARRRSAGRALRDMHAGAYAAYAEYLDGELDEDGLARRIRALTTARVGRGARAALADESGRLRTALAVQPSPPPRGRSSRHAGATVDLFARRGPPRAPASSLLFWSSLDLQRWRRERPGPEWVEYRFRHWLAYTLPSILAQREGEFAYWLLCDPAGRPLTEPLRGAIRDERVRLVYADEWPALLRRRRPARRHLVARIDSDDLYHPDVAGELLARRSTAAFLQFNRGFACDLRSGRVCHWRVRSSPFYCRVYGDELRRGAAWDEPDHGSVRAQADAMRAGRFLVTIHHRNTSSSLPMDAAPLPERHRREVLEEFGLGRPRSLPSLLACARQPGHQAPRPDTGTRALFEWLRAAIAARLVLAPDDAGNEHDRYDLAWTDAAGADEVLPRLLPFGLALIHDTPPRLDAVLQRCVADTYPEARGLTRDGQGRESALVGRVLI